MKKVTSLFVFLFALASCFAGKSEELDDAQTLKILKRSLSDHSLTLGSTEKMKSQAQEGRPRSRSDSDEDVPSLESLIDLDLKWGFKLDLVRIREDAVRRGLVIHVAVNDDPAVQVVNLGIAINRCPGITELSSEKQKAIADLVDYKNQVKKEIDDRKTKFQTELNENSLLVSVLASEIVFFEGQLEKMKRTLKEELGKEIVGTCPLELAYSYVHGVVKNKERIIKAFPEITVEHLSHMPPLHMWDEKLSPHAEKLRETKRLSENFKTMSNDQLKQRLEDVYGGPRRANQ